MNVSQAIDLAMAHHKQGRLELAAGIYQKVLQAAPRHPDAAHLLGLVAHQAGRNEEALRHLARAISLRGEAPVFHHNLSLVLLDEGRLDEAIASAREAIRLSPEAAGFHNQFGTALLEAGRLDEAAAVFERALQLKPDSAAAMNNLGVTLFELGRLDEAETWSRRALEQNSGYARPYSNLAMICQARGQYGASRALLDRALELDADYVEAQLNRALLRLLSGELAEGWPQYQWRTRRRGQPRRDSRLPVWQGEPLSGKSILVYGEQGLGDEIMFASCLGQIVEQAARCIVECDARLVPLLERTLPRARVMARGGWRELDRLAEQTGAEVRIASGSLPRYLRPNEQCFPRRPYLLADPGRVGHWRALLNALGQGRKVGVAWRAGKTPRERRLRSLSLERWRPLLSLPDIHWINLQYGDTAEEVATFSASTGVCLRSLFGIDPLREQDDFAALLSALDLVISVDNATVHLAGAVGAPTWVLLPFDPEWRWQLGRPDSLWYGSVRLFRQSQPGGWEGVLAAVREQLTSVARRPQLDTN